MLNLNLELLHYRVIGEIFADHVSFGIFTHCGLPDWQFCQAAGSALALATITIVVWILKKLRWRWPIEVGEFLARLLDTTKDSDPAVNVEYRDATGATVDFGRLVTGTLRNGHGRSVDLREGVFCGCDPGLIRVGTVCVVSLQEGMVKENLSVQLDLAGQVLFVQSRFTQEELLALMNRRLSIESIKSGEQG